MEFTPTDLAPLLVWQYFNCYNFVEKDHSYYYNGKRVSLSVTQYISKFFEEFDRETISAKYAAKHGKTQEEVLADWDRKGKISSLAGTAIHSWLENAKRGKTFEVDYREAEKEGLLEEVKERVEILLPQAKAFHQDTIGKLFPVQLEYTVGIRDILAGNIDMLCWNAKAQEFQIWDYKNLKEFTTRNFYGKTCLESFYYLEDTSQSHYSIQLNMYKAIIQRVLGIKIGKCYLVHFNYEQPGAEFKIYECLDLQDECNRELDILENEYGNRTNETRI